MLRHVRVAIMHPEKGVLVVAKKGHPFNLTGGKAKAGERLEKAAVRERRQELGHKVRTGSMAWHLDHLVKKKRHGKLVSEYHRVFTAVLKSGHPRPKHEVGKIKWLGRHNWSGTSPGGRARSGPSLVRGLRSTRGT